MPDKHVFYFPVALPGGDSNHRIFEVHRFVGSKGFKRQCLRIAVIDGQCEVYGFVCLFIVIGAQVAFAQTVPMIDGVGIAVECGLQKRNGRFGIIESDIKVTQ